MSCLITHKSSDRCVAQAALYPEQPRPAPLPLAGKSSANHLTCNTDAWVSDTRRPEFAEECRRQARNVAAHATRERRVGCLKRGDVSPSQGAKAITAVNRVRRLSFNRISFNALESVSVLPLTSDLEDAPVFRVVIEPTGRSGISKLSQAMVDKIMPVRKERIRDVIGALDRKTMIKIESAIILFYGIA